MLMSGTEFDFLDPESSRFSIEDIAHGLAHTCRYSGQCRRFYSVAEHCLHVSELVSTHPLAALLHDASEAFIGDVTRPLKQLLPEYKRIEAKVEKAIFDRFGIPYPLPKEVKAADLRVLAAEQTQIMPKGTARWAIHAGVEPAVIKVTYLSPEAAKASFLDRYKSLTERQGITHKRKSARLRA
jgi:hypothetical protein